MGWGRFFNILIIAYFFYYAVVIMIDLAKGNSKTKLASDEGEPIDLTGVDEDHVVNNVAEFTPNPEGSNVNKVTGAEPITETTSTIKNDSSEKVQLSITETVTEPESISSDKDAMAGVQQATISQGMTMKQLGLAFKAGAIETTKDLF